MDSEQTLSDVYKSYKDLVFFIFSKWKQLFLITALGCCLSFLYTTFKKDSYVAQLNFVSEGGSGGGLSAYAGIASQFGIDLGGASGGVFEGDNLVELMKSKNLIAKTLLSQFDDKQLMIEFFINEYKLNKKQISLHFVANSENQNWLSDSMINVISDRIVKKHLSIDKFDKKLDFVYIKFEMRNQFFAKKFVETLATKTIDFYTEYKNKRNQNNVSTVQHQVDSVRNLLYGNVAAIAEIKDLNLNLSRQVPQTNRQYKEIDRQVNAAVYEELEKNLQIAKLIMLKESPLIKIIDKPLLPLKSEKMTWTLSLAAFGLSSLILGLIFYVLYFFSTKKVND